MATATGRAEAAATAATRRSAEADEFAQPAQAELQAAHRARGDRGRERDPDAGHPGARRLDRRQGRSARHDRGDDRPPRREAVGADERSAACARVPADGERLARAALSRVQLRDRRDAQDPRAERRQDGALSQPQEQYPGARWDQSPLFKAVYESEFGTLGGEPYGALVADYAFSHTPTDVQLLARPLQDRVRFARAACHRRRSQLCSAWIRWRELMNPRDIGKLMDTPDYAAWKGLRDSVDSRYVALCMPRVCRACPMAPSRSRSRNSPSRRTRTATRARNTPG